MKLRDLFIEKWHKCINRRYRAMIIVPSRRDLFPESFVDELAATVDGQRLDFAKRYEGSLEVFLTWNKVQTELWEASTYSPILITNLEPFYSKWPVRERLLFLRYLLRAEVPNVTALFLYCRENLTELNSIDENSRGIIWAP